MKKSKIIKIVIVSLLVIVSAGVGAVFAMKDQTYSATDILKTDTSSPDFNAENQSVTVTRLNLDAEVDDILDIEIPEEIQQELIKAFKNAKFEEKTIDPSEYDYRIRITLNRGYPMYLISDKKSLTLVNPDGTFEHYEIVNESDFFSILEKATK